LGRCSSRKNKEFFFEKKSQKTFAPWHARNLAGYAMTQGQKFLLLFSKRSAFLAFLAASPTHAKEVCRYTGTADYNAKIGVVTTVERDADATTVDVDVTLTANEIMFLPISYLVEERSLWRRGVLTDLAANTRYAVGPHIVRQQWDHFERGADGLIAYRVEGKRGGEFVAKFPAFARFWAPASFGQPWLEAFASAPPQRRADLDLTGADAAGTLRTPFATAFYWVRYLPRGGGGGTVFLPGFKTYKTMNLAIAPSGASAWRAPLHYIALSEDPPSSATAIISPESRLQRLEFELHGSAGSARGVIRAQGCEGAPVPPQAATGPH
jgi:hypothetical protein